MKSNTDPEQFGFVSLYKVLNGHHDICNFYKVNRLFTKLKSKSTKKK